MYQSCRHYAIVGKKCEFDIDECIPKPCLNNGTCVDGINGYTCSCSAAYEGKIYCRRRLQIHCKIHKAYILLMKRRTICK